MPPASTVEFRVESPFCGPSAYPLRLSIDSVVVGTDTLRDGQTSPRFATTPGQHRLGAAVTGGTFSGFALDTAVTLRADTVFTEVVNLYCS